MKRDLVDFHLIPDHQVLMHFRLQNWARSLASPKGGKVSPTFALYRSTDRYDIEPTTSTPVDVPDAIAIAKAVRVLPEKHMRALGWYYVRPSSPVKACRDIGCTIAGLAQLSIDARQMLINRRV